MPWLKPVTIGARYGRLTVLESLGAVKHKLRALCRCDCGKVKSFIVSQLRNGKTTTCGCGRGRERGNGDWQWPEYDTWRNMIRRCHDPKADYYATYGARGIVVCEEWRASYRTFLADMGRRPTSKHQIDRIDNDGPYTPANCRWATGSENCLNRRSNHLLTHNGETKPLTVWARGLGIPVAVLHARINRYRWDTRRALEQPVRHTPTLDIETAKS